MKKIIFLSMVFKIVLFSIEVSATNLPRSVPVNVNELFVNPDLSGVTIEIENKEADEMVFCKSISVGAQFVDETYAFNKIVKLEIKDIILNPLEKSNIVFGQEVFKKINSSNEIFLSLIEDTYLEDCRVEDGRGLHRGLDVKYYLRTNGDLITAFGAKNYKDALIHWNKHGVVEGRRPSPEFDVQFYLKNNGDLPPQAGINNTIEAETWWKTIGRNDFERAYVHWVRHGINEGRKGAP